MLKNIFCICAIVLLVSAPGVVDAQQGPPSVERPVLSFVVDPTQGLRPVFGIPGASSIGSPVDLEFPVVRAVVPVTHDYIVAMTSENSWPVLLQMQRGKWRSRSLGSWAQKPTIDRIALSPDTTNVALFSQAQNTVYVFTNLSRSPLLVATFETTGLGTVTAVAVSDDAKISAVSVSDGDTGSVFLLRLGQPPLQFSSLRHPSVLSFFHRSDAAVVADDVENKVYTLWNGQLFPMAAAENGISRPIGVAVSNDNQRVFVGNAESASVVAIGPAGISQPRSCNCTLTGLYPTNTDSVFRLTDFSGGPVLLYDGNGATPRMTFVPVTGR